MTSNSSKIKLATSTILQLTTIGENTDVVKWEFPFFCGVDVDYWSEEKQKFMDIREKSQTALPQKKRKNTEESKCTIFSSFLSVTIFMPFR